MSTNRLGGILSIRRMRADSNSRSPLGIVLEFLIRQYVPWQPRALRSRCIVRTSSGLVGTHGGTTGLQRRVFAAWGEWGWTE